MTWGARWLIYMYHLYEPILLSISLGCALQVVTFTSFVYLVLGFICIVPLASTKDKPKIVVKMVACSLMLLIAVSATIFKTLIMVHINGEYWVTFPNLSTKMV